MNLKKAIGLVTAAALIFGVLTGCGNGSDSGAQDTQNPDAQTSDAQDTPSADAGTDANANTDSDTASDGNSMPEFTSKDLNGNEVTQDIFAQKDLTVLNVWGTFCQPCVNELPELGEWSRDMPDNVQIVGVLCDVPEGDEGQIATAKDIVEKAKVEFVNIVPSGKLADWVNTVLSYPTTVFIDKNGSFVSDPIAGAYVQDYKDTVKAYLNGNNGTA